MKAFSLLRFIRSLDDFGHPIKLSYKGEDTYQSFFGGVFTLLVQVLTAVLIFTGFKKVINIADATISGYVRPVSSEERQMYNRDGLNFHEYGFNLLLDL